MNTREFQKQAIPKLIQTDTIVIGSCRSAFISQDMINGSFFNSSVVGARLEDIIALYYLHMKNETNPKRIILCTDPWLFKKFSGQQRWLVLRKEYYKGCKLINSYPSISRIESELRHRINRKKYIEIYESINHDGSVTYTQNTINEYKAVKHMIEEHAKQQHVFGMKNFEMCFKSRATFEKLLEHMSKQGIRVTLYMAPYHPKAYPHLPLEDVSSYIRGLGCKYRVEIFGGYDPKHTRATDEWFHDAIHTTAEATKKIIENYNPGLKEAQ